MHANKIFVDLLGSIFYPGFINILVQDMIINKFDNYFSGLIIKMVIVFFQLRKILKANKYHAYCNQEFPIGPRALSNIFVNSPRFLVNGQSQEVSLSKTKKQCLSNTSFLSY